MRCLDFDEVVKLAEAKGFTLSSVNGSHNVYRHPDGARPVNICKNGKNKTFGPVLVKQILKELDNSVRLGLELKSKRANAVK